MILVEQEGEAVSRGPPSIKKYLQFRQVLVLMFVVSKFNLYYYEIDKLIFCDNNLAKPSRNEQASIFKITPTISNIS